ncbi:MAG TPA: glycerol-3-phosphate dehydrogenase/oxidase, partial [Limnochordia bacterium]|nr:glycerol-3-phosphate dehydrogenase/oxidase [Limnochordia bacterium]
MQLDVTARRQAFGAAQAQSFDLIVVGGGITGAGIAREAALAGMRVALFEAQDFGGGTSSRSTKLFHGGLRYLAQYEFGLVRESGRERERMRHLGPHLVEPLPFVLPIYPEMAHGLFTMNAAVWMYDWLAGVERPERRARFGPAAAARTWPELRAGMRGAVRYTEYLTDDARCTLAVIKAAVEWGALALNYAPVEGFVEADGRVTGVKVRDAESGVGLEVRAPLTVVATGPWLEQLMADRAPAKIAQSRGVHLVFPRARLPVQAALALQVENNRLVFIIPRGDVTFVGTTDDFYEGDLRHPPVERADIEYLLGIANRYLPEAQLTAADIIGRWSGVRPLVKETGKSAAATSRKEQLWRSPGVIAIAGGKLTAWRKMAEEILGAITEELGAAGSPWPPALIARGQSLSARLGLPGGRRLPPRGVAQWRDREAARLAGAYGVALDDAGMLAARYGDEAEAVIAAAP